MSKIGDYITYVSSLYYSRSPDQCDPETCYAYPVLYQIAEIDRTDKLVSEIDYDYIDYPIWKQLRQHLLRLDYVENYGLRIFDIGAGIWTGIIFGR